MVKHLIVVIAETTVAAGLRSAVGAIGDPKSFLYDLAEFVSNLLDMSGATRHIVIENDGLLPATLYRRLPWKQYAIYIGSFDLQRVTCAVYQRIH